MSKGIEVSRAAGAQVIRINRPDKKNALSSVMYLDLVQALEEGDAAAGVAAHVVLGAHGVFTAGNDLADFLSFGKDGSSGAVDNVMRFVETLPRVKKPLIAGVDGLAVGVGVTMLAHFDLVYASPNAVFTTPFLDLGVVPEAASSLLLPRLMGHQRAFALLVLGEPLSADRALEAGLVNEIVPADMLEEKALAAARKLARKPPQALAIARRLVRGDTDQIMARMNEEAALFKARLASPEAIEAFRAFFEKRPPNFAKTTPG